MKKSLLILVASFMSMTMSAQESIRLQPTAANPFNRVSTALTDPVLPKSDVAPMQAVTPNAAVDYITEQPEGELRTYVRDGLSYSSVLGGIIEQTQDGQRLQVVFDADGKTVWFYEIVGAAGMCYGWVKGEFNETKDKITVKEGQYAWFYDYGSYYTGYKVCRIVPNPDGTAENYDIFEYVPGDIEYSYAEDGTITLLADENGVAAIGLIRDSTDSFIVDNGLNGKWLGYGDMYSVYTTFEENFNQAPSEDLLRESYSFVYDVDTEGNRFGHILTAVFDNDKVYVQGIFSYLPEAWLIGTVENDKVTFSAGQQLGVFDRRYIFFECGAYTMETDGTTGEKYYSMMLAENVVFNLDKENNIMSADGSAIAMGGGIKEMMLVEWYIDPTLSKFEDVAVKPAKPEIVSFTPEFDENQQRYLTVSMKAADVDGNFIDPTKLFLGIFIDGELFTFTAQDYYMMEDTQYLPFGYSDGWYFFNEGLGVMKIVFTLPEINEIGAKCYYAGGGTETESDMATYTVAGVDSVVEDFEIKGETYYDIMGRRVDNPANGIFIKKTMYSDGSVKSEKVMMK